MATGFLRQQDLLGERFHLPTTSSHDRKTLLANVKIDMRRKKHRKHSPKHYKSRSSAIADRRKSYQWYITDRQRKCEITKGSLAMEQLTLLIEFDRLQNRKVVRVAGNCNESPPCGRAAGQNIRGNGMYLIAVAVAPIITSTFLLQQKGRRKLVLGID